MYKFRAAQPLAPRLLALVSMLGCVAEGVAGCHRASVSPSVQSASLPTTPSSQPVAPLAFTTRTTPQYVAHLHRPAITNARNAPAVVLLGGSGGGIGWQDYMAERLAQRGIVAMSVAYFALDSLPKDLERIPLEAFDDALQWLAVQPGVDRRRIGLAGVSKGAEAALLMATQHTELKAVAVFTPSAYVFQSVTRDFRRSSSWTRGGKEVPYIAYGAAPQGSALVEFYRNGVRDADPAQRVAARIPVERMRAPLLMLSGRDDSLWGSGAFAGEIAAQLKLKSNIRVINIVYPNAGHLISSIRTDDVTFRGGTKAGNDFAQTDGQQRFLKFFESELRR